MSEVKMGNSEMPNVDDEPNEKQAGGQQKLKRSVDSMINQMKLSEEEIKYRSENFDSADVKKYVNYFRCTRCEKNCQLRIKKRQTVGTHPLLGVLMCNSCCDYYGDGNFSLDSEGEDKYCRWCGDGGIIVVCSKCICGFCEKCIEKHFGKDVLEKIKNDDDWVCYFCNSKPLWYLRSICSLAEQNSKNKMEDFKSKKDNKRRKCIEQSKGNCEGSSNGTSSDSCESLNKFLKNRKAKRRRFKKAVNDSGSRRDSSSFEGERNKESRKITSSLKRFKKSKESDKSDKDTSSGTETKAPQKKIKTGISSSGGESDGEETSSFKKKKVQVLEKLRGIWKLTQSAAEVGLNSSKERLKRLSNAESFATIESLQKEFKKLELLVALMTSSLNTARTSVDSFTEDFTFENVKDERDIFRRQETNIKTIAKKLLQDSADDKIGKESSESEDIAAAGDSPAEGEEGSEKERSSMDGGSADKENRKTDVEGTASDKNPGGETNCGSDKSESSEKRETEVNSSEPVKPMIKVKSFAKMLGDNVLDNKAVDVEEVQELGKEDGEKKSIQVDEYHVDTDTDKEADENKSKKKKNGRAPGSSSEDGKHKTAGKRIKKEKKKMKASFEKFKEKRERFLKEKEKQEKEKKLKEKKKQEEEKDKEKSEAKEEKDEKETEEEDSEIRGDSEKSEKKEVKRRRKRIIASSDEEENEENREDEEKSGGSEKEKEASDSDLKIKSPKISSGETSSDEATSKQSKYKRIRKKNKRGSSSEPSDNEDDDEKKKKGRKNIKKILKKDSLLVETKEALKNEVERRKRLEERQKLYDELFPENGESRRLILDFDPETKEPLISVHKKLVKKLKPHQMKGVKFMWDNCFESVQRLEEDTGSGCILAHCMGLGKTLQVVTLVHTVMTHDLGVNTVLIVCPLSTVRNWIHEFEMWLQNIHTEPITLYELVKYKKQEDRCFHLKDWHENGGVLVVSYDLFRSLTKGLSKPSRSKAKKKVGKVFEMAFHDPGPDLVICDEGHLLKNEDTALSKCMSLIKTSRRIVLTGTPLQNNLLEYHCMVQFVKPNILGTKKEFMNRFVNPINNGQFEDSTELDVKIMKRRSHVLHSMLKSSVQRFDYSVLTPFLPEKHEFVLSISLTKTQALAYRYFIGHLSGKATGGTRSTALFNDYHHLQRIWTHPRALLLHSEKESRDGLDVDSEGSLRDFVVNSDESTEESSVSEMEEVVPTRRRILRSNANDPEVRKAIEEEEKEMAKHWWDDYFKDSDYEDVRASNKLVILFSLLKRCGERKDKVLVFSQSLYSLDLIEYFLGKFDECSDKEDCDEFVRDHKDSWVLGADYFRLDGSTTSENRAIWCRHFNHESNTRARLFLISTRAGGLGINLYGANRVVIFDASWNPSHDLQSIFRVYRFGQKKPCFIYRFLAEATMEEKIYKRQVTKLSLAHRVVDEHQIERHYSMMNLQELYDYDPTPKETRKLPRLPKDQVFADLLSDFKEEIVSYHEHDSLLENQEEEELSEEERKAAWKEYEDEKVIKAANFNQMLYQQHFQMAALTKEQGVGPDVIEIGDNGPARLINPAFLNLAQGDAGQSFVNPIYLPSSIPANVLLRGTQLGISPFFNESTESFFNRVKMRERWMQGPRET